MIQHAVLHHYLENPILCNNDIEKHDNEEIVSILIALN